MRNYLPVLGGLIVVGAGGFILGYLSDRPKSAGELVSSSGFDLKTADTPLSAAPPAGRSSVSAPSPSPMPAREAGPKPAVARPIKEASRQTAATSWVQKNRMFQALLAGPVEFMVKRTHLGSPERLEDFLKDSRRVERYLAHPLTSAVLGNPVLLRSVLSQPAVVQGFLSSPAMQSPHAVSALASSPLLKELTRRRAVQEVFEDPAFVQQILMNPQTVSWLSRNPRALEALGQFGAMAKALGPLSRPGR